jgi:hypothetical protein
MPFLAEKLKRKKQMDLPIRFYIPPQGECVILPPQADTPVLLHLSPKSELSGTAILLAKHGYTLLC